jgi:hypothetical protein
VRPYPNQDDRDVTNRKFSRGNKTSRTSEIMRSIVWETMAAARASGRARKMHEVKNLAGVAKISGALAG